MKKKIIAFLCVLTCLLSIAGCGKERTFTDIEKDRINSCIQMSDSLIQVMQYLGTRETLSDLTGNYKKHETVAILQSLTSQVYMPISADLGVFEGMLTTYVQAVEDMGGIVSVGECTTDIVGKEVVVKYDVTGNVANGEIIFKYTNDLRTVLTAAETNAHLSFKQNMAKAKKSMATAGLNTLLGMGTVFAVLILISLIISSFNLFKPKNKPLPAKEEVKAATDNNEVVEDLADDTELVAVIMAAISAYEGNVSTDGLVVRSIRRANRRN